MQSKFLTVFAVFDDRTQQKLTEWQNQILALGNLGTQTMNIPFHITLGSFPTSEEDVLVNKIEQECLKNCKFFINLKRVNHFNNAVLFIEPEANVQLKALHEKFDCNYANGFDWHPHATMFCGQAEHVERAKALLNEKFAPFTAQITGIQMGEFFPTKMIIAKDLQD